MTSAQGLLIGSRTCEGCGAPLPEYPGVGRPRRWCDDCYPARAPRRKPARLHEVPAGESVDSVRGMVRRNDPPTSAAAAKLAKLTAGTLRAKCLFALADAGEAGLTDFELGAYVGRQQTSAGKRRGELVEVGYVEKTLEKRPTPSRAFAAVWRITEAGRVKARELREGQQ